MGKPGGTYIVFGFGLSHGMSWADRLTAFGVWMDGRMVVVRRWWCGGVGWCTDKDDMNRYLFYFERYFNHGQSLKIADKQRLSTMDKMKSLVKEGLHFQRVEFLLRATELVLECRRVLKWTYVKAYNFKSKADRTLFEYRQSELEKYTEKLNQLTEG